MPDAALVFTSPDDLLPLLDISESYSEEVFIVVNTFNPLRGLTQGKEEGGLCLIMHHGAMLSSVVPP